MASDHEGNLRLFGAAIAADLRLDGCGRVLPDLDAGLGGSEEDDTPDVPEDESAAGVLRVEDALDGNDGGRVALR